MAPIIKLVDPIIKLVDPIGSDTFCEADPIVFACQADGSNFIPCFKYIILNVFRDRKSDPSTRKAEEPNSTLGF